MVIPATVYRPAPRSIELRIFTMSNCSAQPVQWHQRPWTPSVPRVVVWCFQLQRGEHGIAPMAVGFYHGHVDISLRRALVLRHRDRKSYGLTLRVPPEVQHRQRLLDGSKTRTQFRNAYNELTKSRDALFETSTSTSISLRNYTSIPRCCILVHCQRQVASTPTDALDALEVMQRQ